MTFDKLYISILVAVLTVVKAYAAMGKVFITISGFAHALDHRSALSCCLMSDFDRSRV